PKGQTLFWGYASMFVFLTAILLSKVIYRMVESFMWAVAILTLLGLFWASANTEALHALPAFVKALFIPESPMPRVWDPADATKIANRDHLRWTGRILDTLLFLLGAGQGRRDGVLHGKAHRAHHGQSRGHSSLRLRAERRRGIGPYYPLEAV